MPSSATDAHGTPIDGAKNVSISANEKVLDVYCDLSKDFGVSSTGKSTIVATTSGNKPLGNSGAFLGVNIFFKDAAKRKLTPEAVAGLRADHFQDCSEGCKWRVLADNVTLCLRIDFSTIAERDAKSGKTVLLATSGSFKSIGGTGLSLNLNCYRQKDGPFDPIKIMDASDTELKLAAGSPAATTEAGYTVHYKSAHEAIITYNGNPAGLEAAASLKDCRLGDVTATLSISALKAKRAKAEKEGDDSATAKTKSGFVDSSSEKIRNATLACSANADNGNTTVTLVFDPSLSFGRSASGKSLTVASSGGFQPICGPDGVPIGRLQFNAYRPAPPLGAAEVKLAVQAVLGRRSPKELGALSFRSVLGDIITELGASESQQDDLKASIKDAVKEFLGRTLPSQSQ